MKSLLPIALLAGLAACSGHSGESRSDPDSRVVAGEEGAERSFALADFDGVDLRGPDNVEVTIGDSFSVRAVGDEEALADLEIEVRRGSLRIGRESDSWFGGGSDGRVTVYVTLPRIENVSVAGSGDMTVDRAEADHFNASLAGSGDLTIGTLTTRNVEFAIAGSGNITVSGTAEDIEANIAGSGDIDARGLRARTIDANIAGSGNVRGYATQTAEASLLGSGSVEVRGGAECNSSALGSGELRCL